MYNTSAKKRFDAYLKEMNEETSFVKLMSEVDVFYKEMVEEMEINNRVTYKATAEFMNLLEAKNMVYSLMCSLVDMKAQQIVKSNRIKDLL